MAKFVKWIGGGLGWAFGGPIGGLLGFIFGSFIDGSTEVKAIGRTTQGDYALSLLVLVAAVMKADGKILRSELDFVKANFIRIFGPASANEALRMLRDLLDQDIPLNDVCNQINGQLDYAAKLQITHFLFGICQADGHIHAKELGLTEFIARAIGLSEEDLKSVRSMYVKSTNEYYKTLGVEKSSTDEEIKKAYRAMAVKCHPDKVSYLGEEVKKEAERNFKRINEAYEKIKKERGLK